MISAAINHFAKDAVGCTVRYAYLFADTGISDPEGMTATAVP